MVQAQSRSVAAYSFFDITAADTVTIANTDNVYSINISVPAGATDSTTVYGTGKTLTGISAASGIQLAPGESLTVGDGILPIRYLRIVVADKARLVTMTPNMR